MPISTDVVLDIDGGFAIVGGMRLPLACLDDDPRSTEGGRVRLGDATGPVLRPLTFAERLYAVSAAAVTPDPSHTLADLVAQGALVQAGNIADDVVAAVALRLAGAGDASLPFDRTLVLAARASGLPKAEIVRCDASWVDAIAAAATATGVPGSDRDWNRIVFIDEQGRDVSKILVELAESLLVRLSDPAVASHAVLEAVGENAVSRHADRFGNTQRHESTYPSADAAAPEPPHKADAFGVVGSGISNASDRSDTSDASEHRAGTKPRPLGATRFNLFRAPQPGLRESEMLATPAKAPGSISADGPVSDQPAVRPLAMPAAVTPLSELSIRMSPSAPAAPTAISAVRSGPSAESLGLPRSPTTPIALLDRVNVGQVRPSTFGSRSVRTSPSAPAAPTAIGAVRSGPSPGSLRLPRSPATPAALLDRVNAGQVRPSKLGSRSVAQDFSGVSDPVTDGHGPVDRNPTGRGAGAPDLEDIADDLAWMLQYQADLRGIDP